MCEHDGQAATATSQAHRSFVQRQLSWSREMRNELTETEDATFITHNQVASQHLVEERKQQLQQ